MVAVKEFVAGKRIFLLNNIKIYIFIYEKVKKNFNHILLLLFYSQIMCLV